MVVFCILCFLPVLYGSGREATLIVVIMVIRRKTYILVIYEYIGISGNFQGHDRGSWL